MRTAAHVVGFAVGLLLLVSFARPARAEDPRCFRHTSHVPTFWYDASKQTTPSDALEYPRDCRGCHDYSVKGKPRDPQQTCVLCHEDPAFNADWRVFKITFAKEFETSLAALRTPGTAFEHFDHLNLECRQCHFPKQGLKGSDKCSDEKKHLPGSVGEATCNACHGNAEPPKLVPVVGSTIKREKLAGLTEGLNRNPKLGLPDRGPFLHRDHLLAAEINAKDGCAKCHADVRTATSSDLYKKEFAAPDCAKCHISSTGPIQVGQRQDSKPSSTALTFSHRDHLRDAAGPDVDKNCKRGGVEFEDVKSRGCLACHVYEPSSAMPTYAVRSDSASYQQGCMRCHDVERFRTKDHGNWQACVDCHTIGVGDMKTNRLLADVDRSAPGSVTFSMPPQKHPGIVDKPAQACEECHKAPVRELPTRIEKTRFDHAAHLREGFTAADCDRCHVTRINATTSSSQIGSPWKGGAASGVAPEALLTFDIGACNECHAGIRVEPSSIARHVEQRPHEFSHAAHLKHAGQPDRTDMLCTTCHPFAASATTEAAAGGATARLVGTRPEAANCTLCHQHDAGHAAWTGKLATSEAASCVRCHVDRMPEPKAVPAIDRALVALTGMQLHPPGRACTECHTGQGESPLRWVDVASPIGQQPHPHKDNGYPDTKSIACHECHWAVEIDPISEDKRAKGPIRASEGTDLTRFAGGKKRKP